MPESNLWSGSWASCNDLRSAASTEDERELMICSGDNVGLESIIHVVDQDLHLTGKQGGVVSDATAVRGVREGGEKDEEEPTEDQDGKICERNEEGRSREQRQGGGVARLEISTGVERSEILGEVKSNDSLGEVEIGEGLEEVETVERLGEVEIEDRLGEATMGEVERKFLENWLADFSAHHHLPRAYQVRLTPSNFYSYLIFVIFLTPALISGSKFDTKKRVNRDTA